MSRLNTVLVYFNEIANDNDPIRTPRTFLVLQQYRQ